MSFECPECSALFSGLASLYLHLESCEAPAGTSQLQPASQTFFKCSPCSKVFGSIEEINRHVREAHVARQDKAKHVEGRKGLGYLDPGGNVTDEEEEEEEESGIRLEEIEETIVTVGGDDRITVESVNDDVKKRDAVSVHQLVGAGDFDVRYMCNDCNEVFLTVVELEEHENTKHKRIEVTANVGVRYRCNFCKMVFPTTEEHSRHTVLEHNQFIIDQVDSLKSHNFFKCSRCEATFPVVKDLTEHIVWKHTEEENTARKTAATDLGADLRCRCTLCLKTLLVRSELEPHYREEHGDQACQTYMCWQCNKIFRSVAFLEQHGRVHRDSRPFQCGACQAVFSLASSLHNHVKSCQAVPRNAMNRVLLPTPVVERERKVFQCPGCQKEFPTNSAARQHSLHSCRERRLAPALRPLFPSGEEAGGTKPTRPENQIIFQMKSSDTFEESAVLEGGESLIFEETPAAMIDPGLSVAEPPEQEDDTGGELVAGQGFDSQRLVVLDQDVDPDLGLGPEVLVHSDVAEDNVKAKDRKFICTYCNNGYFAKDHLLSHMRTHTGEKPFECEKCKERFMYRSTWTNHRVRCIEGPDGMNKFRKFTCNFCSSSFLARDHLR